MAGKNSIEDIRFNIENLLGQENLIQPDSVRVLQDNLNKYVLGSEQLKTDGQLGPHTVRAIKQFRNESRYWGGHSKVKVNPLETYELYKKSLGEPDKTPIEYEDIEEDLREGAGDMGPI